jgi:hypothetical protein
MYLLACVCGFQMPGDISQYLDALGSNSLSRVMRQEAKKTLTSEAKPQPKVRVCDRACVHMCVPSAVFYSLD